MAKKLFVECDIKQGMFSDEAVATVGDRAFIVPRAKVRGGFGPRAQLQISTVQRSEGTLVVIPTDYTDVVTQTPEMVFVNED